MSKEAMELALLFAQALDGWSWPERRNIDRTDGKPLPGQVITRASDGMSFSIRHPYKTQHWHFRGTLSHEQHSLLRSCPVPPAINASTEKTPAKLLQEVERRLFLDLEVWYKAQNERYLRQKAFDDLSHANASNFRELPGVERIRDNPLECWGPFYTQWRCEGPSVRLEANSYPYDVAYKIAELLLSEQSRLRDKETQDD